jgi:pimeloyl-ACP methyl ester carboxylesterase
MDSSPDLGGAALPAALTGTRREAATPQVGRICWYEDAPQMSNPAPIPRPLVLIHSVNAAASAYEVKPLYDHYRRLRPVFALDLPGFGLSDRSARPYTPRLMTDAIHLLVEAVRRDHGGGPVDALALSLSSEFLARAAAENPAAYRSIALVSPTGFNRAQLREGPQGSTLGLAGLYAILGRPALGRRVFGLLTRRGVIRYFLRRTWGSKDIDEGLLDYDFAITRPQGAERAPLRFLTGYLFSGDSGSVYRALDGPVWVVHGVRGDFVNYRGLENLRGKANWRVEVLPTGALPHFEMLPEFVARYDAWSAQLEPPVR